MAGLLAASVALAVTELAAGISNGRSLVVAVGDWVINHAPHALVDFGKRNFGTNDKTALVFGIVIVSLLFGAALGVVSRRVLAAGAIGIAVFGITGMLAALADTQPSAGSAVFSAVVWRRGRYHDVVAAASNTDASGPTVGGGRPSSLPPTRGGGRGGRRGERAGGPQAPRTRRACGRGRAGTDRVASRPASGLPADCGDERRPSRA